MNERPARPTSDTVRLQREAGDPAASAWISANAGSGKTHILTERVLRILLTGVPPENILCLTYTKAAAAEMQGRVSRRLGHWAILEPEKLVEELTAIAGRAPDAELMQRARALFAHALETPGGLRINTIHAFCEAVLQRFPFEAGVPVGFSVIEEAEQADMVRRAVETVLAEGLGGAPEVGEAVATLFAALGDTSIEEAIHEALMRSRTLRDVLADPAAARTRLAHLLGVPPTLGRTEVEREIVEGCGIDRRLCAAILGASVSPGARAAKLEALDWDNPSADKLFEAFLTGNGTPPKNFPVKSFAAAHPDLAAAIETEAERLEILGVRLRAADVLEVSAALLAVLAAVEERYARAKALANRLDFDDLITRLVALLNVREARDWVRYKLDAGITHILVDESQDTNPDQWKVVTQLTEEFFSGDTVAEALRTVFAVGDEKQSIYSFQGAEPELFAQTGRELGQRARQAGRKFRDGRFRASFRTLDNVLAAVDLVAADPEVAHGLLLDESAAGHESARTDRGGLVELWPPVEPADGAGSGAGSGAGEDWPTEPVRHEQTPPNRLAGRIVGQIARWIGGGRELARRGRAVTADDVLILVQSRGPLFAALIDALKAAGLPTPGADRLPVTGHVAVADLLALADVLHTPDDDLTLAALLRSPLFAVTEDELMELGLGRRRGQSMWRALHSIAESRDWAAVAHARILGWRQRLDFERPYEFFARILHAEGGLAMFHERLGPEIDDVIAEFLDLALTHEQEAQPGLMGFLAEMRRREISVKRELAETGNGVRVMTVHGAKGLEAPIVILADAATCRVRTGPVYMQGGDRAFLAHVPNRKAHTPETEAALLQPEKQRQMAEYWRKLYVGMTRAEDELYVTGFLTRGGSGAKVDGTWYDKVEKALAPHAADIPLEGEDEVTALRYPAQVARTAAIRHVPERARGKPPLPPLGKLPAPARVETISPSRAAHAHDVAQQRAPDLAAALTTAATETLGEEAAPRDADLARRRGTALHALLQHLDKVPAAIRERVAAEALAVLLPDHPHLHGELAEKALRIFSGPAAATLFGRGSRAELPFILHARRDGHPVRIAGRIDRTIVSDNEALLVDYKSDASPPETPDAVNPAYLTQLGLYRLAGENLFAPRSVRVALFWTETETLMDMPAKLIEAAIEGYTVG